MFAAGWFAQNQAVCTGITLVPKQLESCSNTQKIQQVF